MNGFTFIFFVVVASLLIKEVVEFFSSDQNSTSLTLPNQSQSYDYKSSEDSYYRSYGSSLYDSDYYDDDDIEEARMYAEAYGDLPDYLYDRIYDGDYTTEELDLFREYEPELYRENFGDDDF